MLENITERQNGNSMPQLTTQQTCTCSGLTYRHFRCTFRGNKVGISLDTSSPESRHIWRISSILPSRTSQRAVDDVCRTSADEGCRYLQIHDSCIHTIILYYSHTTISNHFMLTHSISSSIFNHND